MAPLVRAQASISEASRQARRSFARLALAFFGAVLSSRPLPAADLELGLGTTGWADRGHGALRGVTIGPIESSLHPNRGYGTDAYLRTLREVKRLGGTWVSLTPFGRTLDLHPTGVSLTFEEPYERNRLAVARAIRQAHALGLRVFLVPHLWVENGEWRGEIDPGDDAAWQVWAASYRDFLKSWATLARDERVDMLAVGVELRSWLTTTHAESFAAILREIRGLYPGLLTYGANWDDVEDTVILGELDLIGVNAFFPLTEKAGANVEELVQGGRKVAERLRSLAERWGKPIVLTEYGYTTRRDPALRPWEWPDRMSNVVVDEAAQADAYFGLLAPMLDEPWLAGAFAWRLYADPDDVSQESEWGFSPRGKLAELVLRDAYAARWAGDGSWPLGRALTTFAAEEPGVF
jgi:hypothetical protein